MSATLGVAPRVGAWIETEARTAHGQGSLSPPAWGRGLKLAYKNIIALCNKSPPAWGRGLKHSPDR